MRRSASGRWSSSPRRGIVRVRMGMDMGRALRRAWVLIWSALDVAGGAVFASLLWLVLAVLVVPLPAATTALFYAVAKAADGTGGNTFAEFAAGLRERWRRATVLGGAYLVLGFVLLVDSLFFFGQAETLAPAFGVLFASLLVLWVQVGLTFWTALALRSVPWQRLLRESFWVAMAELPRSIIPVLLVAMLGAATFAVPLLIPFAPGLAALVSVRFALGAFRRYGLLED